jgi:hypothetical protein
MFSKTEIKQRLKEAREAGRDIGSGYNLADFITSASLIDHFDKARNEYMHHVHGVALRNTQSETKMIIGLMHDLVEDTRDKDEDWRWTLDDLREVGFSERIVTGVDAMTHREGEAYFDFIVRCSRNDDALDVKMSDLHHNLTESRNNFLLGEKDLERINKYILSYNYLVAIKKGEAEPGSSFGGWLSKAGERLQNDRGWALFRNYSSETQPPSTAPHLGSLQP